MRPSLLRLGGSGRCLGRQPLRAATEQAALHSPRQQHGSTIPAWQDLYTASQLSRWAGMLYMPTAECVRAFEEEGLTVVHHARDKHTCWAVVEGQVDADRFAREALGTTSSNSPALSMASTSSQDAEDQQRQRFVLMRGVQWNAPETVVTDVWSTLGQFWPVPFAANLTQGRGGLVAHAGVSDAALDLFPRMAPFLRNLPRTTSVTFAGHSLGGSLATLLWALSILHGHRTADRLSCHSFGSPPVLAHEEGGGGRKVLELLGAQQQSCRHWVQENDPVPRALMSADPYFTMLMQQSTLRALLEARTWLSGQGSAVSSSRFLYEQVGEVFIIKGGCELVAVDPSEDASLMRMAFTEALSQPGRTVSYWLDHHHSSYAHDLNVAALSQLRKSLSRRGGFAPS